MKIEDPKVLESVAAAVKRLDLTTEDAAIKQITAENEKIVATIASTRQRISELSQLIANFEEPAAEAVADALMSGVAVHEASARAASREDLEREKQVLQASVTALNERERAAQQRLSEAKAEKSKRVADVIRPLVDAMIETRNRAARDILDAYSAIRLLNGAARYFSLEEDSTKRTVEGLMRDALPPIRSVEFPREILSVLEPLAAKGAPHPYQSADSYIW